MVFKQSGCRDTPKNFEEEKPIFLWYPLHFAKTQPWISIIFELPSCVLQKICLEVHAKNFPGKVFRKAGMTERKVIGNWLMYSVLSSPKLAFFDVIKISSIVNGPRGLFWDFLTGTCLLSRSENYKYFEHWSENWTTVNVMFWCVCACVGGKEGGGIFNQIVPES